MPKVLGVYLLLIYRGYFPRTIRVETNGIKRKETEYFLEKGAKEVHQQIIIKEYQVDVIDKY